MSYSHLKKVPLLTENQKGRNAGKRAVLVLGQLLGGKSLRQKDSAKMSLEILGKKSL